MSSHYRKLLDVQRQQEFLQRQNSQRSAESSDQESNVSGNEISSQSEGSSRKTPSEYSLPTPNDERPDIDQFYFGMDGDSTAFALTDARIKRLSDDSNAVHQSLSYIRPEMLASLTSQYGYKYNRYSSVTGVSDLQQFQEQSEDEESEGGEEFDVDFEDDDMYSPIEIARPISLVMPQQKPSVVSIASPRSPNFPASSQGSTSSESRSRSSSVDKHLPQVPSNTTSTVDQEELYQEVSTSESSPEQRPSVGPSDIPPRRGSSKMNNIKKLIRTTSSQLLDIKEDKDIEPMQYRLTEPHRDFDLGAFITSQPVPRQPAGPSLVIPTRSTSRRHSKDFTSLTNAPPLTPRNPRRPIGTHAPFPAPECSSSLRRISITQ